jgi:cysteine desulfurase
MLYFDYNATAPLCATAREAWLEATETFIGNPSSPHRVGARAEAALNQAREKLGAWLGCAPADLVWTSGATESNNAAIQSAALESDGEVWLSAIEHPCVIESARRHFAKRDRLLPVTTEGVLNVAALRAELARSRPALVALMAANNETGVLQPWREVLAICQEIGVPFLCDAAQWVGKLPAAGLGAGDFVSGCAHKFGGPQGVGFLKVPPGFSAMIVGGPQEDGRRAGTENVPGVLAMIAALELREQQIGRGDVAGKLAIRQEFESSLTAALPGATIIGAAVERLWNTVSVAMPEVPDCRQRWVVKLDKLGFAVSTGSACSSGKEQASQVLSAMGVDAGAASRALRFSSGWETRPADWSELLDGVQRAFKALSAG